MQPGGRSERSESPVALVSAPARVIKQGCAVDPTGAAPTPGAVVTIAPGYPPCFDRPPATPRVMTIVQAHDTDRAKRWEPAGASGV